MSRTFSIYKLCISSRFLTWKSHNKDETKDMKFPYFVRWNSVERDDSYDSFLRQTFPHIVSDKYSSWNFEIVFLWFFVNRYFDCLPEHCLIIGVVLFRLIEMLSDWSLPKDIHGVWKMREANCPSKGHSVVWLTLYFSWVSVRQISLSNRNLTKYLQLLGIGGVTI